MKTHDNVLYVTTQKAYCSKDGTNVVVKVDRKERFRTPVHVIGSIVCFGNVTCTPFLLGLCGQEGVGVSYHTESGRFLARVEGPRSGNVRLRRAQHELTCIPSRTAPVASLLVTAKIANTRVLLQRSLRDHPESTDAEPIQLVIRRLQSLVRELTEPLPLERVRGVEGEAARHYWGVFNSLIRHDDPAFVFHGRSKRPPRDAVNALLSFVYALLSRDVTSACESVGLDPQMGFLHADRPGRASLAFDLMEPLRSAIADRLVLSLINRKQVKPSGFLLRESGGVHMDDDTRKQVIVAYQQRKSATLLHPFLREEITWGLLPFIQARLLARWLRGDLDAYPPFFWK